MSCPICKCETYLTVCPSCGGNANHYRLRAAGHVGENTCASIFGGNNGQRYATVTSFGTHFPMAVELAKLKADLAAERSANEELHKRIAEMVPVAELAALSNAVDEARQALGDFVYMGENWSGITRPLDQLIGRSRSTLKTLDRAAGVEIA